MVDRVESDDSVDDSRTGVLRCTDTGSSRFNECALVSDLGGCGRTIAGRSSRRTTAGRGAYDIQIFLFEEFNKKTLQLH